LTITLLVDTSQSMRPVFKMERVASNRFLEQVLRVDRNVAAVVHFDSRVGTLRDFTSSREDLAAALARLKIPLRPGTLLYDGIKQSSESLMRERNGRKAFILLSDGMDVRSRTTIGTAIEYAQRADTMIYSILINSFTDRPRRRRQIAIAVGPKPRGFRGPAIMERLARETGGGSFVVSSDDPIEKIYAQIEDELRNQYSIGYTPDSNDSSGKYRKLKLTTAREGLVVRTRDGYYP
jgi:VWFA-related protein